VAASPWLPPAAALIVTVAVLTHYGVSALDLVAFAAYVALGVTMPGALWYRAATRHRRTLAEDLALGTVLGYGVEVLVYLAVRALGAPLLVLAWPVLTYGIFALVPALRRHWLAADRREHAPLWWSWALAAAVAVLVVYSGLTFFAMSGLGEPTFAYTDADMPFHLALVGELKHHVPPVVPYTGEPLYYHWFYYADLAATSWSTGIEPLVLLRRLSLLPVIAATVVLFAVAGRRITGKWLTGVLAVGITYFVLAPNPYGWRYPSFLTDFGFGVVDDASMLRLNLWQSPTQTFGTALFAGLLVVLLDVIKERPRWPQWLLLLVLSVAVMGGKATYLPIILAGVVGVVLVELILRRRLHRAALAAAGILLACFAFSQVVLFGGTSGGMSYSPWSSLTIFGIGPATGLLDYATSPAPSIELGAIFILCWVLIWCGIVGLVRDRPVLRPEVVLLLGGGLSGLVVTNLFFQQGLSEVFFFQSSRPFLSLAAATGLTMLLAKAPRTWRTGLLLTGSAAAGVIAVWVLRALGPAAAPSRVAYADRLMLMAAVVWPYAVLLAVVAIAAVALWYARRRVALLRGLSLAMVLALIMGFGLQSAVQDRLVSAVQGPPTRGWVTDPGPVVTPGGLEAARWLRDHSGEDDLVATNGHCAPIAAGGPCLNLHFWVSALSERRVLIEGWGFTARANADALRLNTNNALVPFSDPQLLAENDAAFTHPSAQTISHLRDAYGVRWLFVDRSDPFTPPSPDITKYATLRYVSGPCEVYEVPPR
jgi:hypothetical protein